MANKKITIRLKGSREDNEHVRLSDFVSHLQFLSAALSETDHLLTGVDKKSVYFRVVDLKHSSPATVVLEPVPIPGEVDHSAAIISKFFSSLEKIQESQDVPPGIGRPLLEAFRNLSIGLRKNIRELVISSDDQSVEIDRLLEAKISKILETEEISEGSISGVLETINVHNKANKFVIYPSVGPRKITCHFSETLIGQAVTAITKYIRVTGKFFYLKGEPFPHAVEVSDIQLLPSPENLPSLSELRGVAPNATGDIDSVTFIRKIRNAAG
jgi:hypothetical protein